MNKSSMATTFRPKLEKNFYDQAAILEATELDEILNGEKS